MMKKIALVLAFLAAPASAADFSIEVPREKLSEIIAKAPAGTFHHLLMVRDGSDAGSRETFAMQPGACLRGPLYFLGRDGKRVFELDAGVEFPADCGKR